MKLVRDFWGSFPATTISNCWNKTGVYDSNTADAACEFDQGAEREKEELENVVSQIATPRASMDIS